MARLEELGLVTRHAGLADRRMRQVTITPQGKTATDAVDDARERMALALFRTWSRDDFDQMVRLLRMLADGLNEAQPTAS